MRHRIASVAVVVGLLVLAGCSGMTPTRAGPSREPTPGYPENERRVGAQYPAQEQAIEIEWGLDD